MAGGQDYTRHQKGIINRYYEHFDTIALQKLSEIVSDLYLAQGGQATKLWNSARQALAKLAPEDDPHVQKVLSVRSVAGLAKLVTELSATAKNAPRELSTTPPADDLDDVISEMSVPIAPQRVAPAPVVATQPADSASPPLPAAPPTSEELKHAMKAFRKRLKLMILDEESKLGRTGNPMSGGRKSQIRAIMPPREHSKQVWDELVKQGKLKSAGGSFYELVEGQ